ncbi:hypothetical protein GOODEAATRI_015805 [Goodea atripinnis]|uniref:Uncharacterized protein n=1 Tax=Goodea atripinnis TaxID=208336 RepID=A0ABV0N234_9TELE
MSHHRVFLLQARLHRKKVWIISLTWISWMAYSTGTLAKGCFGKVYRQRYNDTWAAVKKVPQQLIDRKNLERECEVYK